MMCNITYNFFLTIFSLYSVYEIYKCVRYIGFNKYLLPAVWKPITFTDYGKWAAITGCTDGIGKSFAHELARLGMNIVLISRSQKKLENLAMELYNNYKVETKIIVADFRNTNEVMPIISKKIANLDIGVLINNVGSAMQMSEFLNNSKQRVNDLVEINVKSVVFMCSAVMQQMVNKKRGIVVNVSSLMADLPVPRISTVYGATKAFVLKFSQDLHDEYKDQGIIVHCLTTGPVVTKLFKIKIHKWVTPNPDTYVKSAMKTIGMVKVTTGYPSHDLMELGFGLLNSISTQLYSRLLYQAELSLEKITLNKGVNETK